MKNYLDFRSTYEAEKWGEKNFPNLVTNEFKKTEEFKAYSFMVAICFDLSIDI